MAESGVWDVPVDVLRHDDHRREEHWDSSELRAVRIRTDAVSDRMGVRIQLLLSAESGPGPVASLLHGDRRLGLGLLSVNRYTLLINPIGLVAGWRGGSWGPSPLNISG